MKFKSPTHDHEVHISLTTGHTCVIPGMKDAPEGVEIHPMFHRDAIARGAEPVGVPGYKPPQSNAPTKRDVIMATIQSMLSGNDESDFKKDGTPDIDAVSRRCGFKVQRTELEELWTLARDGEVPETVAT